MRSICLLGVLGCVAACAGAPRIVATDQDRVVSVLGVAARAAEADVVALGEMHRTPAVHETHLELIQAMHALRPNMVIAMEMFERDVHSVLMQYLTGIIDEAAFRAKARPWPHYVRDYRGVIEFAKRNGIVVLAANAPRELAQKAAKEGVDAVIGSPHVARETTAPEDEYWDDFQEAMEGHEGMFGPGGMERYYGSQCLKDDTMAESLTDYLAERYQAGDRPLAVLICGKMHSDYGRGTVQRIKNRMPELDVVVTSAEEVDDISKGIYESPRAVAEFVIVVQKQDRELAVRRMPMKPKPGSAESGETGVDALPTENPEGLRPALGFRPDYAEEGGVGVGYVTEGSFAEAAGIEEGDVIVALEGIDTPDIHVYSELLDTLIIGRKVTVKVRKGDAMVDLQVQVGSRSDNR